MAAALQVGPFLLDVTFEQEIKERPANHFLDTVSEQLRHPSVDEGGIEVAIQFPNALVGCLDDPSIIPFASLECFACALLMYQLSSLCYHGGQNDARRRSNGEKGLQKRCVLQGVALDEWAVAMR